MSERYREAAPRRGECMACGTVATATVSVHEPTGVAGWTCPECGKTQEPPVPAKEES